MTITYTQPQKDVMNLQVVNSYIGASNSTRAAIQLIGEYIVSLTALGVDGDSTVGQETAGLDNLTNIGTELGLVVDDLKKFETDTTGAFEIK